VLGQDLGRIAPDMDVYDFYGHKIGTLAHVHHYDLARVGAAPGAARPPEPAALEVKTGFLGLGRTFYVPVSAVAEIIGDNLFLSRSRTEVAHLDWEEKPFYLADPDGAA
jgi:hypothetical protein